LIERDLDVVPSLSDFPKFEHGKQVLYQADCLAILPLLKAGSVSAVVTDPPYGLIEYASKEQRRLRTGNRGGIWRVPPAFDGYQRRPLPRFTVLSGTDRNAVYDFFVQWGTAILRVCRPGAHVIIASNTMMSPLVARAMEHAGFERRGEIARLVRTFRGGDKPKNAELEFPRASVTPRNCWEPWGIYRKPLRRGYTVADNLREFRVGALRRFSEDQPFLDVIPSGLAPDNERAIAPHPSLKPQQFMRLIVRSVLPMRGGLVLDPFAGAASTLAACEHLKLRGIGIELDRTYFALAKKALPELAALRRPGLGRQQKL
jgi:DNA modification methylase